MLKLIITVLLSMLTFFCLTQEHPETKKNDKRQYIKVHYENGQIKEEGRKKLQTKTSITNNGRVNAQVDYFREGRWTEYYKNGKKKRVVLYRKGELVKVIRKWKEDGTRVRK